MPKVTLKYGEDGLLVDLPASRGFIGILEPRVCPPLSRPRAAVEQSLLQPVEAAPLRKLARGRQNAVIVISDATRPVPNPLILPPILAALESGGIARERITILVATGLHRPNQGAELERLVGRETASHYRTENHFAKNHDAMSFAGTLAGEVPVYINRLYAEAELKILSGFIEPHMWAGYSGGRKSILPGISSIRTVEHMHGPRMIADPGVVYGKLKGNPFHEAGLEVMQRVGADFIVNLTLDTRKRVTGVYSGHPVAAHLTGVRALAPFATSQLEEPLDFVLTTNSGAPLDTNLYQSAKGIAGVGPVVREGGDLVIASRCPEGLGSREFKAALDQFTTPAEWTRRALAREFFFVDQWCAQEIFKWMAGRTIHLYSEGIARQQQERYGFRPVINPGQTIRALLAKHGAGARWAVVPDGPMLILQLRQ